MSKIAEDCPNVYVKIGGLIPQLGHGFEKRDRPPSSEEVAEVYKDICLWTIQTFGAKRCMFESNFPVDKECVSYRTLWNTFKRIAAKMALSDEEKKLKSTLKYADICNDLDEGDVNTNGILKSFRKKEDTARASTAEFVETMASLRGKIRATFDVFFADFQSLA